MIKIKRLRKPAYLNSPAVLKETKLAEKLFDPTLTETTKRKTDRKKFKYTKYRDARVKDVLKEMCLNKCAYCESTFLHVYYGDIEHFRPKKYVGDKKNPIYPGYYWLSNDWNNLLLSCLFCNQSKKHEILENGNLVEVTIGKQNQFPLKSKKLYETARVHKFWKTKGKAKDDNSRLIIDPCKDNPERYLIYNEEGMILPKKITRNRKKIEDPKGKHSIEVYALQRIYLVQERKKRLISLELQINQVQEAFRKLNENSFDENPVIASYYKNKLKFEVNKLFNFTHKQEAYSAMCRQFVYDYLNKKMKKSKRQIKRAEKKAHAIIDQLNE